MKNDFENPNDPRARELVRIRSSFKFFAVPEWAQSVILQAVHDPRWDWWRDCDGCTVVSEPGWPSKYFPPCLVHDWRWQTGQGGWRSNAEFHRLNKIYRMERWRSSIRWAGVTAAWFGFYKWRELLLGCPASRRRR